MDLAEVATELRDRQPENDMVPTLDRVAAVLELLGDPQRAMRVVQITGTNGKSSTASMIEALLRGAGLRTGRYTSPHLHSPRERICIDGAPIEEDAWLRAFSDVMPIVRLVDAEALSAGRPPITFFELLTCVAYAAFADAPVDVAVVEVGLGGSWDATNIADADVAVICPIGLDHVAWLGDSVEAIATEKAGIIKPDAIAVVAEQPPSVMSVIEDRAAEVGARVTRLGQDFALAERVQAVGGQLLQIRGLRGTYSDIFLTSYGPYQAENAALAVAAVESFIGSEAELSPELVGELSAVVTPGRLELVAQHPAVLLDAAHNVPAAAQLIPAIAESFQFDAVTAVVAMMADKDMTGFLAKLRSGVQSLVLTTLESPRAASIDELTKCAAAAGWLEEQVHTAPDLRSALALATDSAPIEGKFGVLVTGSVVTVSLARELCGAGTDSEPAAWLSALAVDDSDDGGEAADEADSPLLAVDEDEDL